MESPLVNELKMVLETTGIGTRPDIKRVLLKEYLHAYILDYIYNSKKYSKLTFYGGTCLRYLYGLDRFSEDLDFDGSELKESADLDMEIPRYFKEKIGYTDVAVRKQFGERGIWRFTVKFPVLYQLGLSPLENEKLFVKVELSNHKQHADIQKTALALHGKSFIAGHFSLESLFAGKILACLERNFKKGVNNIPIKGRDFYDLLWYMQKGVVPKEEILLKDGNKSYATEQAFEALSTKIETIKPNDIYIDIVNLVENEVYAEKWTESFKEQYFRLVKNYK